MILCASVLSPVAANACRGPFPPPISIEEAFHRAEAVFLGRVTKIEEGLPADFVPSDPKAFAERRRNLERQGKTVPGRTVSIEILRKWKGPSSARLQLVELYSQNTCEWNYDVKEGDRYLVFVARVGNYLTFPAKGFDGRSAYTQFDPAHHYSDDLKEGYAEGIRREQKTFRQALKALEKLAAKPK